MGDVGIEYTKIDNFQIYPNDIGNMNWHVAVKVCSELGDGWRLPTKEELNAMYVNRDLIGNLLNEDYWSGIPGYFPNRAWGQYFANGRQLIASGSHPMRVRPVRDMVNQEETSNIPELFSSHIKQQLAIDKELENKINEVLFGTRLF